MTESTLASRIRTGIATHTYTRDQHALLFLALVEQYPAQLHTYLDGRPDVPKNLAEREEAISLDLVDDAPTMEHLLSVLEADTSVTSEVALLAGFVIKDIHDQERLAGLKALLHKIGGTSNTPNDIGEHSDQVLAAFPEYRDAILQHVAIVAAERRSPEPRRPFDRGRRR